jgi:hypothetical protein
MDHMTLNFNNYVSLVVIFLDDERTFDITWNPDLLCKLYELPFSSSLIKLISSFLSNRKFRPMVESKLVTSQNIQAGVLQDSVPSPTLCSLYIYDTPQSPEAYLAFYADDKCLYSTNHKEYYVLTKLQ